MSLFKENLQLQKDQLVQQLFHQNAIDLDLTKDYFILDLISLITINKFQLLYQIQYLCQKSKELIGLIVQQLKLTSKDKICIQLKRKYKNLNRILNFYKTNIQDFLQELLDSIIIKNKSMNIIHIIFIEMRKNS